MSDAKVPHDKHIGEIYLAAMQLYAIRAGRPMREEDNAGIDETLWDMCFENAWTAFSMTIRKFPHFFDQQKRER